MTKECDDCLYRNNCMYIGGWTCPEFEKEDDDW